MMPDWTKAMAQSFEYVVVDPNNWKDQKTLDCAITATIEWDYESSTLGSATITVSDEIEECYVRIYLRTIQNGVEERTCLGTFLVQASDSSFDGRVYEHNLEAYTPLVELSECYPPWGYYVLEGTNIMHHAYLMVKESARAPLTEVSSDDTISYDFVADADETVLEFVEALISEADYQFGLDEECRIIFTKDTDADAATPVWTYNDDNSSILYPELTAEHDYYNIPNVVEVIYSSDNTYLRSRVTNSDPNSIVSTVSRGREVVYRDTDPTVIGEPTQYQLDQYAQQLLEVASKIEYTVNYTHGYCPVRIGDCVKLNYASAGITNVKAKVTAQSIDCEPGCPVSETAVYTVNLWEGS